jgi:cobyrinic acid a,c-diamide synthase
MQSRFLIGAAGSGSGKTTLTLGLLRAFARRGLAVQPFKCGPDYIDPMYHRLAAGRESINLDGWMTSSEHIKELFARHGAGAEVCVAEGVMGLWDGYRDDQGSSAQIARLLDLPVVMVVDGRSTAYSVAPLLYGFRTWRPEPRIVGVIFNRVAGESHYDFLARAARDAGVEVLGWLPRSEVFGAPERHLGLSVDNLAGFEPSIEAIADSLEAHVDLDRLLSLTSCTTTPSAFQTAASPRKGSHAAGFHRRKIAVARDEAFNFIYPANLARLKELGAELHFFSPLHDAIPPADPDMIYLPGGYPEFFATPLSANKSMREAIAAHAERGTKILAECGGMLYLCRTLTSATGTAPEPMCGVLPLDGTMEGARLRLGYREVHYGAITMRGHEFHYSSVTGDMPSMARQFSARGDEVSTPLYRIGNVIAGYTHLYWAEADPTQLFNQ